MALFARLFASLLAVLAAGGAWLLVDYERGTVFAIRSVETPPGVLAPGAGPKPGFAPPAATDARPARERFAGAFDKSDNRPRVAAIVTGLGVMSEPTFRAIDELPPEVTLAFSTYAENIAPLIARTRDKGHEILLAVPMQPSDPKQRDAGPAALLVNDSDDATRRHLDAMLGRVHGVVGIVGDLGDRFARDPAAMRPVFEELAAKGLLYVENRLETPDAATVGDGVPMATVTIWLDRDPAGEAIDRAMAAAEAEAKRVGSVVVLARPDAATLTRVAAWAKTLEQKGLALAPVSAVARSRS